MTDETQIPDARPRASVPKPDAVAAAISMLVALLAMTGWLPHLHLDTDTALALGAFVAGAVALGRGWWERRANLTKAQALHDARMAAELFRLRLAEVRARHSADRDKLERVAELATKAANPQDPTQLTLDALQSLLRVDPEADTTPLDLPPDPGSDQGYNPR